MTTTDTTTTGLKYQLHYVGLQERENGTIDKTTETYVLGYEDKTDIENSLFMSYEAALDCLKDNFRQGDIPAWKDLHPDVEDVTHEWGGWGTVLHLTWQDENDGPSREAYISVLMHEYVEDMEN